MAWIRDISALLACVTLVLSATPRTGSAQVVDFNALSAAEQAPFHAARIPDAWAFLPTALAANDKPAPEPVLIGVVARGMESGDFGTSIAPHPELDFGCDLAEPECELSAVDPSDETPIFDQLVAAHSASCGPGTGCPSQRSEVNHGTFVAGVIGGVNNLGRTGPSAPQLSNGVLAFTNGTSGAASTGSDVPYQLLYDKTGALPDQMVTAISQLETAGAQVIALSFGWTLDSQACPSDANPGQLTLGASDFAAATTALRSAIISHPSVLFVASAGNCGADASSHIPGGMQSAPANLVTVAATEPNTQDAAAFSNHGPQVQLAAPGVGVPGPIGYGDQGPVVNSLTRTDTASATPTTAAVVTGTGTSGSAAIAAGVAGLYLSVTGPVSASGVVRLAEVLRESDVVAGGGLPGVPRLDALRVVEATVPTGAPTLPWWGWTALGAVLLGTCLRRAARLRARFA